MENQVQVMATLVAELDETTCEVDRWDDLSGLIEDIAQLENTGRVIRSIVKAWKRQARDAMDRDGLTRVVTTNGIVCERAGGFSRRSVDNEGLIKYVAKCAALEDIRIDKSTGEMRSEDAVKYELHLRCFAASARWGELKKLGVDEDDFCSREFVPSVKYTGAEKL